MNLWQTIKLVFSNIKSNKMRTFLTMLGIIIGVAAVIILVSIIQSFIDKQMDAFNKMGVNNISVNINAKVAGRISSDEMYDFANKHRDIFLGATQNTMFMEELNLKSKKEIAIDTYSTVMGVDEYYISLLNQKIKDGRSIFYSDIDARNKICIIGSYIENKAFKNKINLGDTIYINGIAVKVVGILKDVQNMAQWGPDNYIYLPFSVVDRLPKGDDSYGATSDALGNVQSRGDKRFQFICRDSLSVQKGTKVLRDFLKEKLHKEKLYNITDFSSMLNEVKAIRATSSLVAGGVGMISLFVAGIGIMNIMLVSVTERTREIGIRKSLGAKRRDIRWQFVLEAGITGGFGGMLGIFLGIFGMSLLAGMMKLKPNVSMSTVLIAFGISVGVGMIFGFLPANKAANLNPIEALRSD